MQHIKYFGLNLTPEIGANDGLVAVRVLPAGRDGNKVYGRALRVGEVDPGDPITVNPAAGEELHFPPPIEISIQDIDKFAIQEPDGYKPVSNTIFTWLNVGIPTAPELFRFLLSASRRLDTAHILYTLINGALSGVSGPFPQQQTDLFASLYTDIDEARGRISEPRERIFAALGLSESLCVTLHRAVDMLQMVPRKLQKVPREIAAKVQLPSSLFRKTTAPKALQAMRDAFEHIDERAYGRTKRKHESNADALSIFDQKDIVHGVLRYASHTLDLRSEVLPMFIDARRFTFDTAALVAGGPKVVSTASISFFRQPA
jgi:hypothetical protein